MLKSIRFWEKLSLKRFRKQRLASIFLLSLTISVWLGLILPIYPQSPQQNEREVWENRIKGYAERHFENGQAPDTKSVVELFKENEFKVTAPEIGEIYEKEYYRLKEIKDVNFWENIKQIILNVLGWGAAIIVAILFLLKENLIKWIDNTFTNTGDWIYNRISGLKFFWPFSLKRYRASLFNKYRQLKIPFRPNRPLEMRDFYVPLKVFEELSRSQIDALEYIKKYPRLMIKGSPGSGKLMLLKYLAFSWAEERLTRISPKITPVLLELNRLNKLEEFRLEQFKNQLVEAFGREDFPHANTFVTQALENGNLMLLLDGLDKVNSNVRDRVIALIKDLLDTYEKCSVIITCRSAVYHNEFVNFVNHTLEIVEFSDHQIRNFLKAWEAELPPEKSIDQFISTLRDRPQIMSLARNHLLLTIIAYLYADTSFVLPNSRASFYEEVVTHLLKLRDEERQISNQFAAIHKRRVLQKLALFAQDNASLQERDRRNIEYEKVFEQIRYLLPSLNLNPEQDTQAILDEIVARSGLLLPIDGGQRYQFSHLTLQEYFAAEALANQENELIRRFKQDTVTWRETVKLWCGLPGDKTSLIKQVYEHDSLTGFECLADAKEVSEVLADQIIDYFKHQLSKAIIDDDLAKAFGAMGSDLREERRGKLVFEFLASAINDNYDLLNQIASAKALSFTHLPQAATILAQGYKRKKEYCEILLDDAQFDAHKNCLDNIREALVRMGDLGVPQIALLAQQENIEFIQDLTKISTPDSATALVDFLWHNNESLSFKTAWNLAALFTQADITEVLREFQLTTEQKKADYLDWIWQPFNDLSSQSLSIIAGRIAFLIDKCSNENLPRKRLWLDPRIVIPLILIQKIDEINLSDSKNLKMKLDQLKQVQNNGNLSYLLNETLPKLQASPGWQYLFTSLSLKAQVALLQYLIENPITTRRDWFNIYRPKSTNLFTQGINLIRNRYKSIKRYSTNSKNPLVEILSFASEKPIQEISQADLFQEKSNLKIHIDSKNGLVESEESRETSDLPLKTGETLKRINIEFGSRSSFFLKEKGSLKLVLKNPSPKSIRIFFELDDLQKYTVENKKLKIIELSSGEETALQYQLSFREVGLTPLQIKVNNEVYYPSLEISIIQDNPYIYGDAIRSEENFFGRKHEFQTLLNNCTNSSAVHTMLIGEQRSGKTSLLLKLQNKLRKPYIPILISLLGIDRYDPDSSYNWFLDKFIAELKNADELKENKIFEDKFYEDFREIKINFESKFKKIINDLRSLNDELFIVLLLDEGNYLNTVDERLRESLRQVFIDSSPIIRVVFACYYDFFEKSNKIGSPFHNIFRFLYLKPFQGEDLRKLIIEPAEKLNYEYEESAIKDIEKISGGHPFYCQFLCGESFEKASESNRKIISSHDVDKAKRKIINDDLVRFRDGYWNRMKEKEHLFLKNLINQQPLANSNFPKQIAHRLKKKFVIQDMNESYTFTALLFEDWVKQLID